MPFKSLGHLKARFGLRRAVGAVLALAVGIWLISEVRLRFPIRSHAMNELTQNLKTECVGRYLWDVPQGAALQSMSQQINDITIERTADQATSANQVQLRLDQHERELRKELAALEDSGIKEVRPFGTNGKLFVFLRESPTGGLLHAHAYTSVGTAIYRLKAEYAIEYATETLGTMEGLAKALRPRAPGEIPTAPGVCIDGGFVAGAGFRDESVLASYVFKEKPTLGFSMESSYAPAIGNGTYESQIDRFERHRLITMFVPAFAGLSTQRKASIQLAGSTGKELVLLDETEGAESLAAMAETPGDGSHQRQLLSLGLSNDKAKQTPGAEVSDDSALAVWDALTKSVRLRPGAI